MFYYNRTDLSEGIDLTKTSNSKECTVCHHWYLNHGFNFKNSVCKGCWQCCVLIVILLFSLLKALIIVLLFMVLKTL